MRTLHATQAIAGLTVILFVAVTPAARQSTPPVPFPEGFRSWQLVRSTVVGPESPTFPTRGGIHHYYANREALEGYRTGAFPNGSVIVDEAVSTKAGEGPGAGMLFETDRRFLDVMAKNDTVYQATGGWGYEHFDSMATTPSLTQAERATCSECHAKSPRDHVFTKLRP
ncbi:MAG: cytochrome P460 family protein [Vicinamibacteraceae bacterium]